MMKQFKKFQFHQALFESSRSIVYRGHLSTDQRPMIFKILKEEYPTPERVAWFRREYEMTRSLDLPGVVDAHGLEYDGQRWVMLLEDFGGESLDRRMGKPIVMATFLPMAITITEILADVHKHGIIHKDINPANIVYNEQSGVLKLIDFGISTQLTQEEQTFSAPETLEGTLAYISPEQTGRMNRSLDSRSDLYSLGVTFYQMLTGKLPFRQDEPLELIHAHITSTPKAPHEVYPQIPEQMSQILLKLLSKNVQQRYQTAMGLCADLKRCLENPEASFSLGQDDIQDHLRISEKLYGRDQEVAIIEQTSTEVAEGGVRAVFIAGTSGIGKTRLVQEIYRSTSAHHGYFVSGKFEQLRRDIPYSALIMALSSLTHQLLRERELDHWRALLLEALGDNGKLLVDVIPELALIIGEQQELPEVDLVQAKYRFVNALRGFIKVIATKDHPLILFIDDLQWSDTASLELLGTLLSSGSETALYLICTYRSNEVGEAHPIRQDLSKRDNVTTLSLEPVQVEHITQLLSDSLLSTSEIANPLAELIHQKTRGNPFFVRQFLQSLYDEQLVKFDSGQSCWQWDIRQIKQRDMTDNLVTLMSHRVEEMSEEIRQILLHCACIGNRFTLRDVAEVLGKSQKNVAQLLAQIIKQGLVIPLNESWQIIDLEVDGLEHDLVVRYRFTHDRIRQAAYDLDKDRAPIHLKIGQFFFEDASEDLNERIFDIVYQLNLADKLLATPEKQLEMARLNLLAGTKAKSSAAYASAYNYLKLGLQYLRSACGEASPWDSHYALTSELLKGGAEAAYINNDFDQMNEMVDTILANAKNTEEQIHAYQVLIQAFGIQNQLVDGVKTGLKVLKMLGIDLPEDPDDEALVRAGEMVNKALDGRSIASLADLPEMTDPKMKLVMNILGSLYIPAYNSSPKLYMLIVHQEVALSLTHGNADTSGRTYSGFGVFLCGTGRMKEGFEFGKLAVELAERPGARERCRGLMMHNYFIRVWFEHVSTSLDPLRKTAHIAQQDGDIDFVAVSINCFFMQTPWSGMGLEQIAREAESYAQEYGLSGRDFNAFLSVSHQFALNLMDPEGPGHRMNGPVFNENDIPEDLLDNQNLAFHLYLCRVALGYIQADHDLYQNQDAEDYATTIQKLIDLAQANAASVAGMFSVSVLRFYESLILLDLAHKGALAFDDVLGKVEENLKLLETFAENAPMNYSNKIPLIKAELAKHKKDYWLAQQMYDLAIEEAQKNAFPSEEALAFELAGCFWLDHGNRRIAAVHLQNAHQVYRSWGARAKARALADKYAPQLIQLTSKTEGSKRSTTTTTSSGSTSNLDLETLIKATRAISREKDLAALLAYVLEVSLVNAGAERGCLVLMRGDQLVVKVQGYLEPERVINPLSVDLIDCDELSHGIVQYVARTGQALAFGNAAEDDDFSADPFIKKHGCKSVLCVPIHNQGSLVAVVFMENRQATDVFGQQQQEILNLLLTPAAVSIENALLKNPSNLAGFSYQVGGSLAADAMSYIVRKADRELLYSIQNQEYCFVLNARQMGKSSLRIHTMGLLDDEQTNTASVDLTFLGATDITPQQWYAGLARLIVKGLGLSVQINIRRWWRDRMHLPPVQCLSELFDEEILNLVEGPIVIFIDEVDSVIGLNFSADDFFAMIRAFYNKRAEDERYKRLSIIFLGAALPGDLMNDKQRTPFNVGRHISLNGFEKAEAHLLITGLAHHGDQPEAILDAVFHWTSGQPFLTQKLCAMLARSETSPPPSGEATWVAKIVEQKILTSWELQDEPEHLKTIRDRILRSPQRKPLLLRYREILGGANPDQDGDLESRLILVGLLSRRAGKLGLSNRIYQEIFNEAWVDRELAIDTI